MAFGAQDKGHWHSWSSFQRLPPSKIGVSCIQGPWDFGQRWRIFPYFSFKQITIRRPVLLLMALWLEEWCGRRVLHLACEDWPGHVAFVESRFKKWSLSLPSGSHFYQVGHLAPKATQCFQEEEFEEKEMLCGSQIVKHPYPKDSSKTIYTWHRGNQHINRQRSYPASRNTTVLLLASPEIKKTKSLRQKIDEAFRLRPWHQTEIWCKTSEIEEVQRYHFLELFPCYLWICEMDSPSCLIVRHLPVLLPEFGDQWPSSSAIARHVDDNGYFSALKTTTICGWHQGSSMTAEEQQGFWAELLEVMVAIHAMPRSRAKICHVLARAENRVQVVTSFPEATFQAYKSDSSSKIVLRKAALL